MEEEHENSLEEVDVMLSALVDLLIKKKVFTEDEFNASLDEYYGNE